MRTSGEMRIISANRMHDIPYSKFTLDVSTEEYTPGKTCIVASSCCDTNLEYILAEFSSNDLAKENMMAVAQAYVNGADLYVFDEKYAVDEEYDDGWHY